MSACLSPEQVSLALADLAESSTFRIFPLLFETVLFGILTLLVIVATYLLSSKGLGSRPRLLMLILTLTMYAMSAAVWAIDVKSAWVDLSIEIPLDLAGGDADIPGSDSNTYTDLVENVLTAAISITGDAVVLWRACVVWGMRRGMWIFSVILIFVQICAWVVYTIGIVVEYSVPATPASFQPLASPSAYTALVALAFSISLAANVWATAMVAYKTWKHRSDVRRYLNDRTRKSAVEAVFLLLVESGVFYAILWIFYTLADIGEGSVTGYGALTRAEFVWSFGMNQMPGIYLTIVVVVVTLQQSHLESTLSNMRSGAELSLPFSVRAPHTTVCTDDTQQQRSINVTDSDAQGTFDPEIVVVVRESTNSLSDEDKEDAGIKRDEKSG